MNVYQIDPEKLQVGRYDGCGLAAIAVDLDASDTGEIVGICYLTSETHSYDGPEAILDLYKLRGVVVYNAMISCYEAIVENPIPLRIGRPPIADPRTVTFRLRLTPDERGRLNKMAEAEGQTPSQFVRDRVFRD